jgi:ABC-2 type transport system permease protein
MTPIIVGIFAILSGSGLIVCDEEQSRLDLIISHPVGRASFYFGRLLGLSGASIAITILGWLGFSALLEKSKDRLG